MIDALKNLSPLMTNFIVRLVDAAKAAAAAEGRSHVDLDTGHSSGAINRAALFFQQNISAADEDIDEAGVAFIHVWVMADAAAMRRVASAISAPAAKGREAEVVQALMKGASIEEALAGKDSAPASPPVTQDARVVAFPSNRVTSTGKRE